MIKHVNGLVLIRWDLFSSPFFIVFSLHCSQLNCEELIEGFESSVTGVTASTENDHADQDEEEHVANKMDTKSKKKHKSSSSSSKSISILTRSISEYDTCTPEKSLEFDPVQGK